MKFTVSAIVILYSYLSVGSSIIILKNISINDIVVFKDADLPELKGVVNPKYLKISGQSKPHRTDILLDFVLSDLTNIIVDKKSEIKIIYNILYKKFGKEEVDNEIKLGNLSVNSFENISNNY